MDPPKTPSKQKEDPRTTIADLNLRWKLDLREADLSPHSKSTNAKIPHPQLCVKIIRFLFYQNKPALESVVSNFEEWARGIVTEWRWKPRQERGTLPLKKPEESILLHNDLLGKVDVTESKRAELIAHLVELLQDESYLLKGPPEFRPRAKYTGTPTFVPVPEAQGAEQASMLDNLPRNKSFSTLSADAKETKTKKQEAKSKNKRKSLDTEVLINSPIFSDRSSIFDTSVFDDFVDPEPFSPTSGNARENHDYDTNYDEVQDENAPPPKRRSSRSSKSSEASIRNFLIQAPKDVLQPKTSGPPQFALPAPPPPPPPAPTPGISFTSVVSTGSATGSVFDASDRLEPSTQDTDPGIFNGVSTSFDSDQKTIVPRQSEQGNAEEEDMRTGLEEAARQADEVALRRELEERGPFRKHTTPPLSVPLCHIYEASRIATSWNKSLNDLGCINNEGYNAFWEWARDLGKQYQKSLPVRSSMRAWDAAVGTSKGANSNLSVQLTGKLDWADREGIFRVELQPLKLDLSCRLHRKFGPDRFLSLSVPALDSLPRRLGKTYKLSRKGISDWISLSEHHIFGRVWRAFFVESQDAPKTKATTTFFGHRVHFFAIKGEGISEIPITELINWHIPLKENAHSTETKIFQRFSLGLSKTTLGAVLRPPEFVHLPDVKPVMNDGCARMSKSLAREIAKTMGLSNVPSVFQARVAGGKGLWMVVEDREFEGSCAVSERGFFCEISDSQLKIDPHPKHLSAEDAAKLGFEVVSYSKPLNSADVNVQLLSVLQDRGVNLDRLKQLQLDDLRGLYAPLVASKDDRLTCRQWIQNHSRKTVGLTSEILRKGALPASDTDIAALLLESGFEPTDCSLLIDKIRAILGDLLSRSVKKLHIKVPLSTYAFCIADPYRCLAPNEVHFGFSKNWEDADFTDSLLDGQDVLLSRSPAHLPSDVQKRKAVWKQQLRHFKDVIVFPTTGDVPLADLLSGGDYDGDQPWICWDPEIVNSFQNVDKEPQPDFTHFGITKNINPMVKTTEEIDGFLSRCFDFNFYPTFLPAVSIEHEKVRYHENRGVSCNEAKELAVLAGLLVDAPKQGYHLSVDKWLEFRSKVSPRLRDAPAYKHVEDWAKKNAERTVSNPKKSNYIDVLKFEVALPEKGEILQRFHEQWGGTQTKKDADILRVWQMWCSEADLELKKKRPELHYILEQLKKDIRKVRDNWNVAVSRSKRGNGTGTGDQFEVNVQTLQDEMQAIMPKEVDHALVTQVRREERQGIPPSQAVWNLLRASCAYDLTYQTTLSWYAAGETLCSIKAFAGERDGRRVRNMREDIYIATKMDSRVVKKILAKGLGQEDDGEEAEWADDEEAEGEMLALARSGVWE